MANLPTADLGQWFMDTAVVKLLSKLIRSLYPSVAACLLQYYYGLFGVINLFPMKILTYFSIKQAYLSTFMLIGI